MKTRLAVAAVGLLVAMAACDSEVPQGLGDPTTLVKVAGDAQSDTAGAVLDQPLVVGAVSRLGREPREDVTVEWSVTSEGGAISAVQSTTDSTGLTGVLARLPGGGVDSVMTVEASLAGRAEVVVFTATVTEVAAAADSAGGGS